MAAEKFSEAGPFTVHIAVHLTADAILAVVETILLLHEGVGIFGDFLTNSLMRLEVSLQRRMALHELLVVYQRWVAAKLFSRFAMAVEELIETRQLSTSDVAVLRVATVTASGRLAVEKGCLLQERLRVLAEEFSY